LVDTSANVRQTVRILIFSPPLDEELAHFRRLVHWLPDWLPPGWYEHQSLRPLVAELIYAVSPLVGRKPGFFPARCSPQLAPISCPCWSGDCPFPFNLG
jgi:hypothetical protein